MSHKRRFPHFEGQTEEPSPFLPAEEKADSELFPLIETALEEPSDKNKLPEKREVEKVKAELQKALVGSFEGIEKPESKVNPVANFETAHSLDERIERLKKELGVA